ncbi:PREDICTED: calcium-binding and coiled-coil domain-containing protein 1-like [Branchiostoma belcheri]|uniref:Calcium-binding and coiled-coil domain-containing protein 1-like n=1 Tax=Branchiostoma belcheri TaxID=7741 RepID=A0A6P4ZIJ1_BRABE|nr:PREDICTED: calcium-binding and coiled-coil domain-containing protein 1-like [Branchiostoma belcheri]
MARAETTRDLVVFDEIQKRYRPDESIFLVYTLHHDYTPSKRDWVGLFKVGWKAFHEYIAFEWAPKQPKREKFPLVRSVHFLSSGMALPPSGSQKYSFLYVSRKKGVVGSSTTFKISEYPDQLTVRCRDAGHDDFTIIETSVSGQDADSFVVVDADGSETGRVSPIPWQRSDAGDLDLDFSDAFAELFSTGSVENAEPPVTGSRKGRRRSSTSLLLLEKPDKVRSSSSTLIGGLDLLVTGAETPEGNRTVAESDATSAEEKLSVVPYKSFFQDCCSGEMKAMAGQEEVEELNVYRRFGVPLSMEKKIWRRERSKNKGKRKLEGKRNLMHFGPLTLRDTILQQVLNSVSQKALLKVNVDAFLASPWIGQSSRACAQATVYPPPSLHKACDGALELMWKAAEQRFKSLEEKLHQASAEIGAHEKRVKMVNDHIRSLRMRLDKSRDEVPSPKKSASTNTVPHHFRDVSAQTSQSKIELGSTHQALRAERDALLERVATLTSAKQQQEKAARKLSSELDRLRDKRQDLDKYVDDVIFTLCTMGYTVIEDTKGNRTDLSAALPDSLLKGKRGKHLRLPALSEDRPLKMKSQLLEMKVLKTEAEKAEAQALNLKTEIASHVSEATRLRTETSELKTKISDLESELARLRAENADLATTGDELKTENAELRKKAESARERSDEVLTDMIFLKEDVKEKGRELKSALCREKTLAALLQEENEDRKKLSQQLAAARVEVASVKGERDALVETVEQQRRQAKETSSAAQDKDRDARKETEKLKRQIAELEAKLLLAETTGGLTEKSSGASCATPAAFNASSDTPPTTTVTTTHLKVLPKEEGKLQTKDQDSSLRSPPSLVPGVAHRMMMGARTTTAEQGGSVPKQTDEVFSGYGTASPASCADGKHRAVPVKRKPSLESKFPTCCNATRQIAQEPKSARIPRKRPVRSTSAKKSRSTCPYCREPFPAGTEKARILKHIAAHSKK